MTLTNEKNPVLPEVTDENTVRVIPVSGVEEIGRNMIIVETKDDMVVIDAGFQFVSEESNAPGTTSCQTPSTSKSVSTSCELLL